MIRVMIIEDEPPILRSLKTLIEKTDGDFSVVASAYDGEEAVDLLKETPVDVVFTDIMMPVADGFHVLDYLKEYAPDTIPVILSGYAEFDYARRALTYNVAEYLLKPIDRASLERLLGTLKSQLSHQRLKELSDVKVEQAQNSSNTQIMATIEDYLKKNMTKPITHQTLAEEFGFSAAYVSRLFKQYRGVTPAEYLLNLRLEKAKLMLEENPSLLTKNVARTVGFHDPFYFSKLFKRAFGMSPKAFKGKILAGK